MNSSLERVTDFHATVSKCCWYRGQEGRQDAQGNVLEESSHLKQRKHNISVMLMAMCTLPRATAP